MIPNIVFFAYVGEFLIKSRKLRKQMLLNQLLIPDHTRGSNLANPWGESISADSGGYIIAPRVFKVAFPNLLRPDYLIAIPFKGKTIFIFGKQV